MPDGASSLAERPLAPPTARFSHLPESHDGTNAITFRIYFSEDFPMSFRTLRDEALEAINGRVAKAQRYKKGSNLIWNITVQPDGRTTWRSLCPRPKTALTTARYAPRTGGNCTTA